MLCFQPLDNDVAVAANAPAAEWDLKLLPFEQIKASAPPPPPPSATQAAPAATPTTSAAPASDAKPTLTAEAPKINGKANGKTNGKNGKPQPQVANTASGFQR